jgi:hypothetical protein
MTSELTEQFEAEWRSHLGTFVMDHHVRAWERGETDPRLCFGEEERFKLGVIRSEYIHVRETRNPKLINGLGSANTYVLKSHAKRMADGGLV